MKLLSYALSLSIAGVALAAAAREQAEVYIIDADTKSRQPNSKYSPPSIPRQLARAIILSHAKTEEVSSGGLLGELPPDMTAEDALQHLSFLGQTPDPLFGNGHPRTPAQVIMMEGATAENTAGLKSKFKLGNLDLDSPLFTIADPPAAEAHQALWEELGAKVQDRMDLAGRPRHADGYAGVSDKPSNPIVLILLPESSRTTGPSSWSSVVQKRQNREAVMEDTTTTTPHINDDEYLNSLLATADDPSTPSTPAKRKSLPACFASQSACTNATGGCSGHGECANKYGEHATKNAPCFQCVCQIAWNEDKTARDYWAGKACDKRDVSTPFWLIAGMTIVLVGLVSFSIGLLFSVGEEQLPGVIGAGVSRPSK